MRKKLKKVVFNLLWLIISLAILFVASGIFLTKKYEDLITQRAVEQVNQLLETKISIDEIKVSLFSKFPYVSVVFKDVVVWSAHNFHREEFVEMNCDTLLSAENIYLQFNITQLLFRKYNIKRVLIDKGSANLLIDQAGNRNYKIFMEVGEKNEEGVKSRSGQIEALRLSNFNIQFNSKVKNIESDIEIKDILLKGKIENREFSLASNSSFKLKSFSREGISYADNLDFSIKTILDIKEKRADIKKGVLSVNNVNLNTTGLINYSETPNLDLQIEGRGLDINSVLEILPGFVEEKVSLSAKGTADVAVRVNGPISAIESPEIKSVFLLKIFSLSHKSLDLRNLQLKGKFTTGENRAPGSSVISVEKFQISNNDYDLEGNFYLRNFHHPEISMRISGYADLLFVNDLWINNPFHEISGTIHPNFKLETTLASFRDFSLKSILDGDFSGEFGLMNTGFSFDKKHKLRDINGTITVSQDSWLGDIDLYFNESETSLLIKADYLLNYIFNENQSLWLLSDIKTDILDLNDFIETAPVDGPGNRSRGSFLPKDIYGKINLEIGKFSFRKFSGENLNASMEIKPGQMGLSNYSMNAMRGKFSGNAAVRQDSDGNFTLASTSNLTNIDVRELFESFNNFNQKVISSDNLSGKLSGDADFSITSDSLLKTNKRDIILDSRIVLRSGELINFEPVKKLSNFIKLEELEHIQFSTITNSIFIKNELITIPEMNIKSSATDIIISGTHSFNNYFDYKMKINLSDILARKAGNSKLENAEKFVLEDDGRRTSLYLSVKGSPGDYHIKYDKKEAVSNIRKDLKKEKNTLKNILNEEFGWFKKDSLKINDLQNEKNSEFILDWGEQDNSQKKEGIRPKKRDRELKKEEEGFVFEWDEDEDL